MILGDPTLTPFHLSENNEKLKKHIQEIHESSLDIGEQNSYQNFAFNKFLPKGDIKMKTGSRQVKLKIENFNATTCENNVKRAKRKFLVIEHETSTMDSPSKRPNNVPGEDENFPQHASDNKSDTSWDSAFFRLSTKSVDSPATSAVDKVLGSSEHLSPSSKDETCSA